MDLPDTPPALEPVTHKEAQQAAAKKADAKSSGAEGRSVGLNIFADWQAFQNRSKSVIWYSLIMGGFMA